MNTAKKIGLVLIIGGIAIYYLAPEVYRWIPGAMCGAGFGLLLFFGPKKVKNTK